MRVPLSVHQTDQGLFVYYNNHTQIIPYPFRPFVLVQKDQFENVFGKEETWRKVPNDEDRLYTRVEFNTPKEQYEFKKSYSQKLKYIYSNPYLEQIFISQEDFFLKYPHTNDIIVMFYDIEVASKGDGLFPTALTNEILCIGYSVWQYYTNGTKKKLTHKICKGFNLTTFDKDILDDFFNDVQLYNPDILSGYFSEVFDLPYIMERAKIVKCDLKKLSRTDKEPYIDERGKRVIIPGRIHYDIFSSNTGVVKDQTLFGIKSKTLKDLGRWHNATRTHLVDNKWTTDKMEDIELPEHMEDLMSLFKENPDRLYAYLDDDIYRTECVGQVYIRNCLTLADMMKIPLENIMTMYSSFVPKMILAREMEKLHLINTETNFNRYNIKTGSIAKLGSEFEGAITGIYKNGFIPAVWKVDVSSEYPSVIQTFNLGPDTTSLVRVEEYTGKYNCTVDNNYNWYRIPTTFDKGKYRYDLIIRVRNDIEGFLKQKITNLKIERKKVKAEMKECQEEQLPSLEAQQYALKVNMNSAYGLLGEKTTIYGDLISAVIVTAMGRWCMIKCMQKYSSNICETDSVTGDTPIYVKNRYSGKIDIIPIEDLHISNKKRQEYKGIYQVLTRSGWHNILYTKKHTVNKKIFRVKISDGYVDCTEDHSLFSTNHTEIKPKDITINKNSIETYNIDFYNTYKSCFSLNFCWLIGFLIAEGSVYIGKSTRGTTKCQVSFNGNDKKLMKYVKMLANKEFGKRWKTKFELHNTMKSSGVYKVQGGYNLNICKDLKNFCYCLNKKDKKIPNFILNGSKEQKESFLNGLMSGDGYIAINKGRKVESLDSKFKSLSAGVRFLWHSLGYKTTCNIRHDKPNITTYKKRFKTRWNKWVNINKNIVTKKYILDNNINVYDISTEDGTFITALGDIVLHNTDGIYVDKPVDIEELNQWIDKEIKDKFKVKENFMRFELEGNGEKAYFYLAKNYILEKNVKGKITYIKHGVSLKSSKHPKVVDRATDLGIEYIFNNKPLDEVVQEAYNFKGLSLDYFVGRIKMVKNPIEYSDQYDWHIFLAKQVELKTHQIQTAGAQIQYVIAKKPLPFQEFKPYYRDGKNYTFIKYINSIDELDFIYYTKEVDKALEKFGISRDMWTKTNLFTIEETKKPINTEPLDIIRKEEL